MIDKVIAYICISFIIGLMIWLAWKYDKIKQEWRKEIDSRRKGGGHDRR